MIAQAHETQSSDSKQKFAFDHIYIHIHIYIFIVKVPSVHKFLLITFIFLQIIGGSFHLNVQTQRK